MAYKQTTEERINQLRRMILVHSCLYYRFNETLINDHKYDSLARELMELQKKHPELASACVFAEAFSDFDGTTSGFNLPLHDPWVVGKAQQLLNYAEKKGLK
jgi:NAD-dependent DNA ligase